MRITSAQNPAVKFARSLERSSVRRKEHSYLAEGVRIVREALLNHIPASHIFYDPSLLQRTEEGSFLLSQVHGWAESVYEVDERILRAIADTETPAGIVVVLRRPVDSRIDDVVSSPFGVVLDGLGDPGNVGTIMRTAAATGPGYVVATPGTVDLYSPKVVRAGMGAHFGLRIVQDVGWDEIRNKFREISLIACDMSATNSVYDMSWPCPMALVVGSEAHGLSKEARDVVQSAVRIPMRPGVESLNASVAAAIVIYEARGRRIESDEARYR